MDVPAMALQKVIVRPCGELLSCSKVEMTIHPFAWSLYIDEVLSTTFHPPTDTKSGVASPRIVVTVLFASLMVTFFGFGEGSTGEGMG